MIERPLLNHLDISGWDIQKALKLLQKSNPPLLEWLRSPIVYMERYSISKKLTRISDLLFSPKSCIYHYLHMAEGNYREYLRDEEVRVKKYFYVLRPILACKWIERFNTMPPIEYEKLVKTLIVPGPLMEELETLLKRKRMGEELDRGPKIEILNQTIATELERLSQVAMSMAPVKIKHGTMLDDLFRQIIKKIRAT